MKEKRVKGKYLGKGICAKCYLLEDGVTVYKKFKYPHAIYDIERFKYFKEKNKGNILFPYDFNISGYSFVGYYTTFVPGQTLNKSIFDADLYSLAEHSIKLEKNIDYISHKKIVMLDFHCENIMYDYKKITVIDPDEYSIRDWETYLEIKKRNLKIYSRVFNNLIVKKIKCGYNDFLIESIHKYKDTDILVSDMIYQILNSINCYYKEDIKTIKELNYIGKSKKKIFKIGGK